MKTLLSLLTFFLISNIFAQNIGINVDGSTPDASAILDLKSNDRGFLPPRLTTTERDAIPNPALGLTVFNTTTGCFNTYQAGTWRAYCPDGGNDCPLGMIDLGTFSIEDTIRSDTGYFRAVDVCHSLGSHTRLCRPSEWYIACRSGLVPTMAISALEWVDDFTHGNNGLIMGVAGDCQNTSGNGYVYYLWNFRCCCEH